MCDPWHDFATPIASPGHDRGPSLLRAGSPAEYHAALDVPDGKGPGPDDLWLRYRASTAYGLAIWLTTAASTWQRPEVSLALVQRYAAAFADLDGAAAVGRLTA